MPEIDDPRVVKFCNEVVRPLADRVAVKHIAAKLALAEAQARGILDLTPDDDSPVADGAPADGRPPMTGAQVHAFLDLMGAELLDYEADGNAKAYAVLSIAVNYPRV